MAASPLTADELRDANVRYHDHAATAYDAKWGIDFGPAGLGQVSGKLAKALGVPAGRLGPFDHALEIGAGTGYFALNLALGGVVRRATATDVSPGMIDALRSNAGRLGLPVRATLADAEALPFEDGEFDLVLGHAVLHHIPDLATAFAEMARVLRPGGVIAFAGEPSRHGDRLAALPKRAAHVAAPAWRFGVRARRAEHPGEHGGADPELENVVDVHAFAPGDLERHARLAGFEDVRVRGEELLANWFGWANRALEATAEPADVPRWWQLYAYHGYLALQSADRALLEPRLPPALFYNLLLGARKPA